MSFPADFARDLEFNTELIEIRPDTILAWLGYESDSVEPYLTDLVAQCLEKSKSLIDPKGVVRIIPVSEISTKEGSILLDDTTFHAGKIITSQLKNVEYLAIFVVTIGLEIETWSKKLFDQGDMLEGYITNIIGSESADALAEQTHKIILPGLIPAELGISNRFSPGYCNWNVAEQFKIFSFFPKNFKAVTLTESALMHPVKSVSGIVGIGKNVVMKGYKCQFCTDDKCIFKRHKI